MPPLEMLLCLAMFLFKSITTTETRYCSEINSELYETQELDENDHKKLTNFSLCMVEYFFKPELGHFLQDMKKSLINFIEKTISNRSVKIFTRMSLWPKTKLGYKDVCFSPFTHTEHVYLTELLIFLEILCKSEKFLKTLDECCKLSVNGTLIDLIIKFYCFGIKNHRKTSFPASCMCFFKTVFYELIWKACAQIETDGTAQVHYTNTVFEDIFDGFFVLPIEKISFSMIYHPINDPEYEFFIKNGGCTIKRVGSYVETRGENLTVDLFHIRSSTDGISLDRIQTLMPHVENEKKYTLKGFYLFKNKENTKHSIHIYIFDSVYGSWVNCDGKHLTQYFLNKRLRQFHEIVCIYEFVPPFFLFAFFERCRKYISSFNN